MSGHVAHSIRLERLGDGRWLVSCRAPGCTYERVIGQPSAWEESPFPSGCVFESRTVDGADVAWCLTHDCAHGNHGGPSFGVWRGTANVIHDDDAPVAEAPFVIPPRRAVSPRVEGGCPCGNVRFALEVRIGEGAGRFEMPRIRCEECGWSVGYDEMPFGPTDDEEELRRLVERKRRHWNDLYRWLFERAGEVAHEGDELEDDRVQRGRGPRVEPAWMPRLNLPVGSSATRAYAAGDFQADCGHDVVAGGSHVVFAYEAKDERRKWRFCSLDCLGAALEALCPKGPECALNKGAAECHTCGRRWPQDDSWTKHARFLPMPTPVESCPLGNRHDEHEWVRGGLTRRCPGRPLS